MSGVKCFQELKVWQKARILTADAYRVTRSGNFAFDPALRNQVRRACVSVMANIAEGFGRYSHGDFRRFINMARGSISEVQSHFYVAMDQGYLSASDHARLNGRSEEISRMLASLHASLQDGKTASKRTTKPHP